MVTTRGMDFPRSIGATSLDFFALTPAVLRSRTRLLDYLVGPSKQPTRYCNAKGPGGPVVDNQLEPCRQHDTRLGWCFAPENPARVNAGEPIHISGAYCVAHQAAEHD